MYIKKTGKNIFGAVLTSAEKKAMDIEIQKELAEYDRKNVKEICSIIIRILRDEFGFSKKKAKQFYMSVDSSVMNLIRYYELGLGDDAWISTRILKEQGIDIDEWEAELHEKEKQDDLNVT